MDNAMNTDNTSSSAQSSHHFHFYPSIQNTVPDALVAAAIEKALSQPEAGFWPEAHRAEMWRGVREHAEELRRTSSRFVVSGIGGSSLGARTLAMLIPNAKIYFLEHLDPESLAVFQKQLGSLHDLHWVWTSKSGATLETLSNLCLVEGWYARQGLNLARHSTVVCEPKASPLRNWAEKNRIRTFDIPSQVSGRFSVLSPAGLLSAGLAQVDLAALEAGVRSIQPTSPEIIQLIQNSLASLNREEFVTSVWTYCDRLKPFVLWFQQLWAESLAKAQRKDGSPAPRVSFLAPSVGSVDQHSLLQQFVEGGQTNWIWALRVDELEASGETIEHCPFPEMSWLKGQKTGRIFAAQAEGTLQSLRAAGAHTLEWRWPKLDAFYLGQAFITLEILVASLAEIFNIHGFNQPGVEGGKLATLGLLKK